MLSNADIYATEPGGMGAPFGGVPRYADAPYGGAARGSLPVRIDERFNYADGELAAVAPAVWQENGTNSLFVASGDITSAGITNGNTNYSPIGVTIDPTKARSLTVWDLTMSLAVAASQDIHWHMDCLSMNGSGGIYVRCAGADGTLAVHSSLGTTAITVPFSFGAWQFGKLKFDLGADGTGRLYRNGSLVITRTGAARPNTHRYFAIGFNTGPGNTNTPNVRFSRLLLQGTAV